MTVSVSQCVLYCTPSDWSCAISDGWLNTSPLYTICSAPSSLAIGWCPCATSTMLSRRCPSAMPRSMNTPTPSGPRCAIVSRRRVNAASSIEREELSGIAMPQMPHMSSVLP